MCRSCVCQLYFHKAIFKKYRSEYSYHHRKFFWTVGQHRARELNFDLSLPTWPQPSQHASSCSYILMVSLGFSWALLHLLSKWTSSYFPGNRIETPGSLCQEGGPLTLFPHLIKCHPTLMGPKVCCHPIAQKWVWKWIWNFQRKFWYVPAVLKTVHCYSIFHGPKCLLEERWKIMVMLKIPVTLNFFLEKITWGLWR